MKKVINGKMYNTETAHSMADTNNGYGYGDFHYVGETLYKKKTGEYFLHGEGGACSQYAESYGNGMVGGETIIPVTEREAKKWVERNCDGDTYIKIFGEVEE